MPDVPPERPFCVGGPIWTGTSVLVWTIPLVTYMSLGVWGPLSIKRDKMTCLLYGIDVLKKPYLLGDIFALLYLIVKDSMVDWNVSARLSMFKVLIDRMTSNAAWIERDEMERLHAEAAKGVCQAKKDGCLQCILACVTDMGFTLYESLDELMHMRDHTTSF